MRRLRIGTILHAGGHEFDLDAIGRLKIDRQAAHQLARVAIIVVRARQAALPCAASDTLDRQAGSRFLAQRSADKGTQFKAIEAFVGAVDTGMEFAGRLGHDVVDRTAGGALTEQCALRALENFDTLDVEIKRIRHHWHVARNLVGIDRNRRRRTESGVIQADTAQRIDRRRIDRLGEGEARHQLGKIGRPGNAPVGERFARCSCNREADIVDRLLTLVRSDDDIASIGFIFTGLREGGPCVERCDCGNRATDHKLTTHDIYLPDYYSLNQPAIIAP